MEASYELIVDDVIERRKLDLSYTPVLDSAMSANAERTKSVERTQSVERTTSANAIERNKLASIEFAKKRRERAMVAQEKRSGVMPSRSVSPAENCDTFDPDVQALTDKVALFQMVRRRRSSSAPSRKSVTGLGLSPEQAAIIQEMRAAQANLGGFLCSSKKTMESSSAALWGHFKQIPQEQLQWHIILRFNSYAVGGSLDRADMREALAEMGCFWASMISSDVARPAEEELDALMSKVDLDGDGRIDLDEFSVYIFEQIGVQDSKKARQLRKAEETLKSLKRTPSAPADL